MVISISGLLLFCSVLWSLVCWFNHHGRIAIRIHSHVMLRGGAAYGRRAESLANTESCSILAPTFMHVCPHADDLEAQAYTPYFPLLLLTRFFCGRNGTIWASSGGQNNTYFFSVEGWEEQMGANYAQRGPTEHTTGREWSYLASYLALPTILAARLARGQEVSGPEEQGVYQCCREQSSQGRIIEIARSWARGLKSSEAELVLSSPAILALGQ